MQSEDEINKKLGRTIAKKRKAAGYTQDEVSAHLDIGKEAFSRIERGISGASVSKLYALAELFECEVETFFVDGGRRQVDQTDSNERLFAGLSSADRQLVVQIVEKLTARLKAAR